MFERFAASARAAVEAAYARARAEGAAELREEHLLAGLFDAPAAGPLLSRLGAPAGEVLQAVAEARRRAGLSAVDGAALAGLGIDLEAVVTRVEAQLGPDALREGRRGRAGRLRLPVAAGTKLALQAALRSAGARGDRELRDEHLLLGLVAHRGPVADALGARGVTTATVLTALDADRPASGRAS
jgi:ATP-dependent Clp protease ATP-binding subunit ClpA